MKTVHLSTAYLAPVQYYCKLYSCRTAWIEAAENYPKQTYRNRCTIAAANGLLPLSVPVVKPATLKCPTKDIRISDHGNWRHLHWNALVSAYNTSPFFEYYADDFIPFYQKKYDFLLDFNEELRRLICKLLGIEVKILYTESYQPVVDNDYREAIRPRHGLPDEQFNPVPYYQVFGNRFGFQPNLSIIDLLFNMGAEGLLILKKSAVN